MNMRRNRFRPRIYEVDERELIGKEARPHPDTPLAVLDFEAGLPTVPEARGRLQKGLDACRREGRRVIKIIHGYGSTGVGGRLRRALRGSLFQRKQEGVIRDFILGEEFHDFCPATTAWVRRCPVLLRDYDYDRVNKGITIIIL